MKKLLLAFLLSLSYIWATPQTMVDVATGEYSIGWISSTGVVKTPYETVYNTTFVNTNVTGLTNIVAGDGGQYHSTYIDNTGHVFTQNRNSITSVAYPLDNLGNAFTCDQVYSMWRNCLALKAGQVYYWSNGSEAYMEDILRQFGPLSTDVPAPRLLTQPPGSRTITKLVFKASTGGGAPILWGICSDGTMWQWDDTHTTPFQVLRKEGCGAPCNASGWTGNVVHAAFLGPYANMVVTSTNQVWAWGYSGHALNGFDDWQGQPMTNVTSNLTSAGIVFPLKKVTSCYLSVAVIDANDHLFTRGQNQSGQLGTGFQTPSWKTAPVTGINNFVYGNDTDIDHCLQGWVQIPGKWSNIKSNTSYVFYMYGQDMAGNWYSWGRNKAKSLGNGKTWGNNDQGTYSEYLNIPAPRLVDPINNTSWVVNPADGAINVNAARLPIASAGINQYLTSGTTSTSLVGTGSHQQQPTSSLTVTMTNLWTRISGPNTPTLTNSTSPTASLSGMIAGTYVYRNTVTNSVAATDYQEVTIVIASAGNTPPTANAGGDQTITLPTDNTTVTGIGTDSDGSVASYLWTKTAGPTGGTISSPTSTSTGITALQQGTYTYEYKVTDNLGAFTTDNINITVNPATPPPSQGVRGLFRRN